MKLSLEVSSGDFLTSLSTKNSCSAKPMIWIKHPLTINVPVSSGAPISCTCIVAFAGIVTAVDTALNAIPDVLISKYVSKC